MTKNGQNLPKIDENGKKLTRNGQNLPKIDENGKKIDQKRPKFKNNHGPEISTGPM